MVLFHPVGSSPTPYLFLFCVESFSARLKHVWRDSEIHGVNFGGTAPLSPICCLLMTVLSWCINDKPLEAKRYCHLHVVVSCQRLNLQKSSIFSGKGCEQNKKEEQKQMMSVDSIALLERYLWDVDYGW